MSDYDYQSEMCDHKRRTKKVGGVQPGLDVVPSIGKDVAQGIANLFAILDGKKKNKPPKYPPEG